MKESDKGSSAQEAPDRNSHQAKSNSRRAVFKILLVAGLALALTPTVILPFVQRFTGRQPKRPPPGEQRVVIDGDQMWEAAAGKPVNVSDTALFPPNSHWVITYPSSGDPVTDSQVTDTFKKFELIRLPIELGGEGKDASSFVAFSKVCVHLECSPNYNPHQNVNPSENGYSEGPTYSGNQSFECPCHGSTYRLPDGLAVHGPSSSQDPPRNAVPILTLSTDDQGFLWVNPPIWDYYHNGVIGVGRYVR